MANNDSRSGDLRDWGEDIDELVESLWDWLAGLAPDGSGHVRQCMVALEGTGEAMEPLPVPPHGADENRSYAAPENAPELGELPASVRNLLLSRPPAHEVPEGETRRPLGLATALLDRATDRSRLLDEARQFRQRAETLAKRVPDGRWDIFVSAHEEVLRALRLAEVIFPIRRDDYLNAKSSLERRKAAESGSPYRFLATHAEAAVLAELEEPHVYLWRHRFGLRGPDAYQELDAVLARALAALRRSIPSLSEREAARCLRHIVAPLASSESPLSADPDALRQRARRHSERANWRR